MKLLARVEKCRECWFLICLSVFFFFLRMPSLIEPYWYGDEGIYEVIGQALRNGRMLYTQIWDNKPPLLYLFYALFSGDQFSVRLLSLFFGIASVIIFFLLSRKILAEKRLSYLMTTFYAVLFGLPFLEGNIANAENFMQLPILLACFFVISLFKGRKPQPQTIQPTLFFSGLLLGGALLLKVVAIFDFVAIFLFLFFLTAPVKIASRQQLIHWLKQSFQTLSALTFGFLLPFLITALFFLMNGALIEFLEASFIQNVGYVGYKNAFFIPQGLLIIKLFLLGFISVVLFLRRTRLSPQLLFLFLWTAFSLFNAFFSQRPYTHYVLVALPSILLFAGSLISLSKKHLFLVFGSFFLLFLLAKQFNYYSLKKTMLYYPNFISFVLQQKSVSSYQAFFDSDTPRDYKIALFLRSQLPENASVLVWGNNAQIYALSHTLPPGRYTVAYHISSEEAVQETDAAMKKQRPSFIVILPYSSFPSFSLHGYSYRLGIKNALIYGKDY